MSNELPWGERVNMLSINPDAATRDDVAKLAASLGDCYRVLWQINEMTENADIGVLCMQKLNPTFTLEIDP